MNQQRDILNSSWRVAIIGGGISGMAAAHRLVELCRESGRRLHATLFEAGSRLGGVIHTRKIDDFLVETGPDMFITDKPAAVGLCQRLGLEDRLIGTNDQYRRSLVLRAGKPVLVPEGFTLLSPARIWPVLKSPIFSPWGKMRMALEVLVPARRDKKDESLSEFVRRRFGQEALDRLIQPLVGGIYTADPDKLSLKAAMPRFPEMEAQHRSLILASKRQARQRPTAQPSTSGARYGLFATLEGGLSELINRLQVRLADSVTIRLNTSVESLTRTKEDDFQITTESGTTKTFQAVVLALPAYRAADLLSEINRKLADALNQIPHASSAVVISGHRLCDIRHPINAFGLVIPFREARQILAVSFASRKFPGRAPQGKVILRTFVGGALQPELLAMPDEEIIQLAASELKSVLGVSGPEEFNVLVRYNQNMPQYHVGHLDRIERITAELDAQQNLALAGNSFHGVGIPDCVQSGEAAAERLFKVER